MSANWHEVSFGSTKTGLTPTFRQYDNAGVTVSAATNSGVVEIGGGAYGVFVTMDGATVGIEWDSGTGIFAHEDVVGMSRIEGINTTITTMAAKQLIIEKILRNRTETNPITGVMTVYDDDNVTPLFTASLFEDVGGATAYTGAGADRRNRLS